MAKKKKEEDEHRVTLEELKDLLFYQAREESRGYKQALEKYGGRKVEIPMEEPQRLRYCVLFAVIDKANLNEEFQKYCQGK